MNEAQAIIVGAAIAVVPAGVASWVTWKAALKQALIGADSLRDTTRMQIEGNRVATERQLRRDAYAAFLQQVETFRVAVTDAEGKINANPMAMPDLNPQGDEMWVRLSVIRLEGPDGVFVEAGRLRQALAGVVDALSMWQEGLQANDPQRSALHQNYLAELSQIEPNVEAFVRVSQEALGLSGGV